ncbi:hypothetical protein GCM10023353_20250 [Tomitella cavernea]|uniref:Uncharacterized protein n=1 Tax=Tomitella cavernea TaxID=1387982 RepID=A0ABP9CUK4_9ACTN
MSGGRRIRPPEWEPYGGIRHRAPTVGAPSQLQLRCRVLLARQPREPTGEPFTVRIATGQQADDTLNSRSEASRDGKATDRCTLQRVVNRREMLASTCFTTHEVSPVGTKRREKLDFNLPR